MNRSKCLLYTVRGCLITTFCSLHFDGRNADILYGEWHINDFWWPWWRFTPSKCCDSVSSNWWFDCMVSYIICFLETGPYLSTPAWPLRSWHYQILEIHPTLPPHFRSKYWKNEKMRLQTVERVYSCTYLNNAFKSLTKSKLAKSKILGTHLHCLGLFIY